MKGQARLINHASLESAKEEQREERTDGFVESEGFQRYLVQTLRITYLFLYLSDHLLISLAIIYLFLTSSYFVLCPQSCWNGEGHR